MTTLSFSPVTNFVFAIAASGLMLGFAAVPAEAASVEVTVSAAQLATAEGRAAVDARIARAAEQVCGAGNDVRDLARHQFEKLCIAETLADARAKVAAVKASTQMAAR